MSRIRRNMGDSGKIRFYELDHASKMRRLKTHSHTSNRLAMEPGTRRRKAVERNADPTTRQKSPIENLPRAAGMAGGAEKALEPAAYHRCGGGGVEKALRQTNQREGTVARRARDPLMPYAIPPIQGGYALQGLIWVIYY